MDAGDDGAAARGERAERVHEVEGSGGVEAGGGLGGEGKREGAEEE